MEEDKLAVLAINLNNIAQIWHKNIWSIHRFLKAVKSKDITINNFLDLVFTLESFFEHNTSTEMMRLIASILTANNKQEAQDIDQLLINNFRIRNEVVHGGKHYSLNDYSPGKINGKKKIIMKLFWELKNLNINLIILGINKLLIDKNPVPLSSIRFKSQEIKDKFF